MPNIRTYKGFYTPLKPEKYVGEEKPVYRSSWEYNFMRYLDLNPKVIYWASESVKIPYRNPFTGKSTVYVPDFFFVCEDSKGNRNSFLVEIKPVSQADLKESKTPYDRASVVLNQYKWRAAEDWCKARGVKFIVLTEKELFNRF